MSSDELLHDTNLMIVKSQTVSFGDFTFSPHTYKSIPEVSKPRRAKKENLFFETVRNRLRKIY